MPLKPNGIVKVWKFEDKNTHGVAEISTSKKNKETGKYETDFNEKFVRIAGGAYTKLKELPQGCRVRVKEFAVSNKWDNEKKVKYTNYTIFDIEELEDNNNQQPQDTSYFAEETVEDDPF